MTQKKENTGKPRKQETARAGGLKVIEPKQQKQEGKKNADEA